MPVNYKLITDFDQFIKLRQSWNELVEQCDVDHAFMRHEWFECWIRKLGRKDNLMILTAWQGNYLMAIAPMQIINNRIKGFFVKVLCYLSSGITPRCNFIIHESIDVSGFFNAILKLKGWDLFNVQNVEADLDITKKYIDFLDSCKKKYYLEPSRMSPFLLTTDTWDSYKKTLSKSFRTNLNNGVNRLKREKSFRVYRVTEYNKFEQILDQLVETSAKSWKVHDSSDLKSTPDMLSFYVDFTRHASDLGLFELWVLEIDNQVAVFDYYLKANNKLSLIRTDFDLDFKFYNPGNTLKQYILIDLFNRPGVWEYDMGGQAADYKIKWTNQLRKHYHITINSSSLFGNIYMIGKTIIQPIVKKVISLR